MKERKTALEKLPVVICFMMLGFIICMMPASADEGMWTFDNPPVKQLKERYGFTPTQSWLDHVRLSSPRFMDGGSGSFVSPEGLVMTNHHVAVGQLQKISTAENNYVEDGFLAKTRAEERKCPDLEINVLVSMEDVTEKVLAVVKEGMSDEEALKARRAERARIEKESLDQTGLRSNVVSLYHGGEYWLYQYKKYTDLRMVMAPEQQAAYFGGDFDNFTFPRFCLDVAFFRVYENDQPLKTEHYFKWNAGGAEKEELVFVPGNPGFTDRLYTYDQLVQQRDQRYPMLLQYIDKRMRILRDYSELGPEQARRGQIQIFGLENGKKALSGEWEGLKDKNLMAKRKKDEEAFRKLVAANPQWQAEYGDAWDAVSRVVQIQSEKAEERFFSRLIGSRLAGIARSIVFYVLEVQKPDAERLEGYHEAGLEELKFRLFSPAPIFADLEEANLGGGLEMSLEALGPDHRFIKTVLNGGDPKEVAKMLIQGTRLADVEYRKSLIEGGGEAVKNSDDPLIILLRKLEPILREDIEWNRKHIESVLTPASEKIAQARFAVYGKETYPDATFTPRLAYGAVRGFPMNGTKAPCKTTLYGLFDRSESFEREGDFALPERFWERKDQLDLSTPVNFASTCDIIGGNSGSPVINAKAEVVGLIFDGNIESLAGRYVYEASKNRAVSVHTGYITEALRKLYDAGFIADELEGK